MLCFTSCMGNILCFYFKQLLTVVNFSKGAICGFFNHNLKILKVKNKFKKYSNPFCYKEEKTNNKILRKDNIYMTINTTTTNDKTNPNTEPKNKLNQVKVHHRLN